MFDCAPVFCLPACLFFPFGVVFVVHLFHLLLNTLISSAFESSTSFLLTNPSFHHNFTIQLGTSTITHSETARNLGVIIDDQLTFPDHIAKTARSCRFAFGTCFTTPCSSSCSVQAELLQCSLGRSSSQFYQTFNPERGCNINF